MRIPGRRIALLLALPAVIGLAFATANSQVTYQADGKGSGTTCSSAKKAGASGCASAQKAGASGCASAQKVGASGCASAQKAGAPGCASAHKASASGCSASKSSCGAHAQACTIEMVRGDDALKVFVLGSKETAQEWMTKVAANLVDEQGLEAEVFEAKDGCWMEIRAGKNSAAYNKLLQVSSSNPEEACKILCDANGCPPKA